MSRRSYRAPVPSPSYSVARSGPPVFFAFAGLMALMVVSALLHHPFLAFLGFCWLGSRIARRARRWSRDEWDVPHDLDALRKEARHEARRVERDLARARRSKSDRQAKDTSPELPAATLAAWRQARAAVQASTALADEDRAEMLSTLDAGLKATRELHAARARLGRPSESRLGAVADAAAARASQFEADCATLRQSLAALEIQEGDDSALSAVSRAADELAHRVAARREVDRLL